MDSEELRESFAYQHEVIFNSDANVLILSDISSFDDFRKEFNIKCMPVTTIGDENFVLNDGNLINWKQIASKYQGIIITPYQRERRMGSWYYPWDCASGCIWDVSCIKSLEATKYDVKAEWGEEPIPCNFWPDWDSEVESEANSDEADAVVNK